MVDSTPRVLALAGAILFAAALVTGAIASLGLTGQLDADGRTLLSAHTSGLMGSSVLFALGWSLPLIGFTASGKARLAWLMIVPSYSNWLITTAKAFLKVHGLGPDQSPANNVVFVLLTTFVVLPFIVAAIAWIIGLAGKPARLPS